ncbi:Dihydroorotate dehydrogenase [Fluviicola taffensis DSM 16823]|uniref:Dihydroorotate dehydrogenase (quinone) n=2 Tax=Fluviicola TaxID=332102 RepID=F2IBP3_FLUTR|nr:Dihydroorotate dehydrogenase [Fluviicola taffensis DSM 16823]
MFLPLVQIDRMYPLLRWFLFKYDPEKVHYFTFKLLGFWLKVPLVRPIWKSIYCVKNQLLETEVAGIKFPNPVGLAAGFDKNALRINELAACGFGFVEIGTVTPVGQDGNPKPRLFRLIEDQAIINRMGFNNDGAAEIVERLKKLQPACIIGGNIGKNKVTPNEDAISDYLICYNALEQYVDYFVVNVSSPNTPNLRELQDKEPLTKLLQTLMDKRSEINSSKPIFLKIAPDLTDSQLDDIIAIVKETEIAGIIATNTTIERGNLVTSSAQVEAIGMGGVSGKPLKNRSTEVVRYLYKNSNGSFPIIGVGGIYSAEDALEKLEAGASLIQLYSGFIYEGPGLVKKINKAVLKKRKKIAHE